MKETEKRYLDAAKVGDLTAIKAILADGVDIDVRDNREVPKNRTALMYAAGSGHLEVVDLLLNAGADPEAKDKGVGCDWPGGNTALILAIKNNHIQVANRLLDAGANPMAKSVDTTALRASVEIGNLVLIKRLTDLGADPLQVPADRISAILAAIYDKNVSAVELFLQRGADPNAKTPGGGFLLSSAVFKGDLGICERLHHYGASPNVRNDKNGFTPLMTACIWSQNEEVFRFLLSIGAKVNEINIRNETAMDLIEQAYQRHLNASPAEISRMARKGEDVKETLKSLEKIKTMLREAGAKYYKELAAKQTQAKEEPPNKKTDKRPEHEGVSHFLQSMCDGPPEWSLFAVKAPLEEVSRAYMQLHKAKKRMLNVPLRPAGNYDEVANIAVVVQVKDNPWTILFRSISFVDLASIKSVFRDAKKLSSLLKTRAMTFIGEGTSGVKAYEIFEAGKSLEKAEWESGGAFTSFKSNLRKEPDAEIVDGKYVDGVFRGEGIYVPSCYAMSDNSEAWLAIDKVSIGTIQRADLIELAKE